MNYKTYLFDFDYTLADSSRGIVKCFRIVLTRHFPPQDLSRSCILRMLQKTVGKTFSLCRFLII